MFVEFTRLVIKEGFANEITYPAVR